MNIDTKCVMQAGGLSAFIGLVLGLLATIPFQNTISRGAGPDPIGLMLGLTATIPSLGCILMPLLCVGFALPPTGAGLGYGNFVRGRGNLALGGALAGAFGGFVYGAAAGLVSLASNVGRGGVSARCCGRREIWRSKHPWRSDGSRHRRCYRRNLRGSWWRTLAYFPQAQNPRHPLIRVTAYLLVEVARGQVGSPLFPQHCIFCDLVLGRQTHLKERLTCGSSVRII